jgi:heme exporter protein D
LTLGDKYALFVWPAYGLSALAMGWMILDTVARARRWRRAAQALEKEAAADEAPAAPGTENRR